ncbi:MAG: YhcH/YjgK/YiaL family protein [Proteobacteria bacterium]|nr:YhcH/YjgK/YiaL family protein [Pseudomonadota bacterium]MBU1737402.1 YhcH/YjgK/YiaL family protein [Pseudomonadota bacterium]
MILDVPGNGGRYLTMKRGFAEAFDFLNRPDLRELEIGRHEIAGDRVYAMVAIVPGREREGAMLEAHNRYIDIQMVLSGTDEMGWKARSACTSPVGRYDRLTDEQLYADEPVSWIPVRNGSFVIFFPEDAHLPLISAGEIHKVVVKIAVDK